MNDLASNPLDMLVGTLSELIRQARTQALRSVDVIQVQTCWQIGRHIVKFDQGGDARAAYGTRILPSLAEKLTAEYGKGFDERNLRNMRAFFQTYPIWYAVRSELSWTHYRALLRVENPTARAWYMNESASQNWSSRALERQIASLYYEQLLSSRDRAVLEREAATKTAAFSPREFIRDPMVLEASGFPTRNRFWKPTWNRL